MSLNYYKAISSLITYQERMAQFSNKKNELVIRCLSSWDIGINKDEPNYPDTKEIATQLGIDRQKVNVMVKDLYTKVIESFYDNPLQIQECVHVIYISIPYDEENTFKNKEYLEIVKKQYLWFETKLPVTPRIGEEISLDFIDSQLKHNRGYVIKVQHEIIERQQRIILYVHPFKDYYHQWNKMKEEFEWKKRRDREWERESRV